MLFFLHPPNGRLIIDHDLQAWSGLSRGHIGQRLVTSDQINVSLRQVQPPGAQPFEVNNQTLLYGVIGRQGANGRRTPL
jgi:hypothetical protein